MPRGKKDHPRLKSGRLSPAGLTCLCGCGEDTVVETSKFLTGHDATLKGVLTRKLEKRSVKGDKIPAIAIPFLVEEGLCGYQATKTGKTLSIKAVS